MTVFFTPLLASPCRLLAAISVSQSLVLAAGGLAGRPHRRLGLRPSATRLGRLAVGEDTAARAVERFALAGVSGGPLRGEPRLRGGDWRLVGDW